MLDMYDFQNDIWLCHSFRGQCYNFTAFVIYSSFFTYLLILLEGFNCGHGCVTILDDGTWLNIPIKMFSATGC